MVSIGVLFIALILLIGLGLLISVGIRSLAKHSPVIAFSVLGVVFLLLLALVLSIPTLRYQSACRNLGSTDYDRCEDAFAYLIRTKGVRQAFDLAFARGSVQMRASLPGYVKETYTGKWDKLDEKARQRITEDQALKILVRCLDDPDTKVASAAAYFLINNPFITPQNVQAIIPYLNRDLRPASDINVLWWLVKRPGLLHAIPDQVLAKGLIGHDADRAVQVFEAKYCGGSGSVQLRPGAPRAMLLDMLASQSIGVQAFGCFRLHEIFAQAVADTPHCTVPLLGNRAFEQNLGIPAAQLCRKLQQFLRAPGKKDSIAREFAEEMLDDLTGKKQ